MNMAIEAVLFALAFVSLAGHGCAQTPEELAAIRTTVNGLVEKNPIYKGIPSEFGCKENAKKWILGCMDLLPAIDQNLGKALNMIAKVEGQGENVVINGNVMRDVLLKDGVVMTMECCAPLCLLAKAGCGCKDTVFDGLIELVGGDVNVANEVLRLQAQQCTSDIPSLDFESTLKNTPQCSEEYVPIAKKWTCA
ncbi:hypothetical protein BSKO_07119 [Bryopsis sp. KO-2023]|nr:hypothetical protein BSKO_07119 [Bryopsis sp. KO-2023]